ncbi:MAG: phosphoenolpyruvate synthase [Candidatus Sericytochromatia bacterium]|nr:phosphoenolpyruvate synthase [Candidatus Sericytochromatia bacterium]
MRSKAETLQFLHGQLSSATVLPLYCFNLNQWQNQREQIWLDLAELTWTKLPVIVRSSALNEDSELTSMAGHYCSVLNVSGKYALEQAIEQVAAGFQGRTDADQIFIQPMLSQIALSGVAFSQEPSTGIPCLVFNYQECSQDTTAVTGGHSNELNTWHYYLHNNPTPPQSRFRPLLDLVSELQLKLGISALDLEVALLQNGQWVLLQVRPLVLENSLDGSQHLNHMLELQGFLKPMQSPHPFLYGQHTVYGVMPDWNPAEIIGIRPRPLARSLYQELITDSIWAYQRHNYGYRNLRSFPLMVDLGGCPYIDVRVSFNSFIPATLPPALAEKLADYYLKRLVETPSYHDKVEFEIIYSCYTLDLPQRLKALQDHGFSQEESDLLAESLRLLTNKILHQETGLWQKDIAKLEILTQRRETICSADLGPIDRIYWLLEDGKRYGTLPFAGLARAGFIAVQMLNSLVQIGALDPSERSLFMQSLDTVSSRIQRDFQAMNRSDFLKIYGHLRPGTYDILSERYDQAPDRYFGEAIQPTVHPPFSLRLEQLKLIRSHLQEHGLNLDVLELFDFMKAAIEGREYAKFLFTRNLSDVLEEIAGLGRQAGMSREDCSFLDIQSLLRLLNTSGDLNQAIKHSVEAGKAQYSLTQSLLLPPLITQPEDIWQFELQPGEPNFITLKRAKGPVCFVGAAPESLKGTILLIPSADPGYDWIFGYGIAGLITLYGGVNSHMAIRAGEMGIPAVIGAGEVLYSQWQKARELELDCATRQVRVLA